MATVRSTMRKLIQRLDRVTTMTDALEIYEASAGSCEVRGWKDQRTFLKLLQAQPHTETDIGMPTAYSPLSSCLAGRGNNS